MRLHATTSNPTYLERLVSFYGTTLDPTRGGFLLPSGDFLDLSAGTKGLAYDHTHIRWVLSGARRTAHDDMIRVAKRSRMYRWTPSSWSVDVWTAPTHEQADQLASLATRQPLTVSAWTPSGQSFRATYSSSGAAHIAYDLLSLFEGRPVGPEHGRREPELRRYAAAELLSLIEDAARVQPGGLVRVSALVDRSNMSPEQFRDTLVRLDREGIIELRPESSVPSGSIRLDDLTPKHMIWYPKGPKGVPLTMVRLRQQLTRNPEWADRELEGAWDEIVAFADDHRLPMPKPVRNRHGMTFREYGCGTFGCVYPTEDKNVVVKLTKDETELYVANLLRDMAGQIDASGIVKYHGAMQLQTRLGGRRLFLLWRENATNIGGLDKLAEQDSAIDLLLRRLERLVWYGNAVRVSVIRHAERVAPFIRDVSRAKPAAQRLLSDDNPELRRLLDSGLLYHRLCRYRWTQPPDEVMDTAINAYAYFRITQALANDAPHDVHVGRTILALATYGILLADVHHDNVGQVTRGRSKVWVITDPGRIAVINPDLPQP